MIEVKIRSSLKPAQHPAPTQHEPSLHFQLEWILRANSVQEMPRGDDAGFISGTRP